MTQNRRCHIFLYNISEHLCTACSKICWWIHSATSCGKRFDSHMPAHFLTYALERSEPRHILRHWTNTGWWYVLTCLEWLFGQLSFVITTNQARHVKRKCCIIGSQLRCAHADNNPIQAFNGTQWYATNWVPLWGWSFTWHGCSKLLLGDFIFFTNQPKKRIKKVDKEEPRLTLNWCSCFFPPKYVLCINHGGNEMLFISWRRHETARLRHSDLRMCWAHAGADHQLAETYHTHLDSHGAVLYPTVALNSPEMVTGRSFGSWMNLFPRGRFSWLPSLTRRTVRQCLSVLARGLAQSLLDQHSSLSLIISQIDIMHTFLRMIWVYHDAYRRHQLQSQVAIWETTGNRNAILWSVRASSRGSDATCFVWGYFVHKWTWNTTSSEAQPSWLSIHLTSHRTLCIFLLALESNSWEIHTVHPQTNSWGRLDTGSAPGVGHWNCWGCCGCAVCNGPGISVAIRQSISTHPMK